MPPTDETSTVPERVQQQTDRFLELLAAHVTIAGGSISASRLGAMPLREVLHRVLPNGIKLMVVSDYVDHQPRSE